MLAPRLPSLLLVAAMVVATAAGCATTSSPSLPPSASRSPTPAASASAAATAPATADPAGLPPHRTIAGAEVDAAFDLATDGRVVVWSDGTIDRDAPDLWRFDPATGRTDRLYRSADPGAILANLAVRDGRVVFSEVTTAGTESTWRLVLLDADGSTHVLDADDHASGMKAILPMAALSDTGVLWATSHGGTSGIPSCELRYAALADLVPRVIDAAGCDVLEFWYPSTDGATYVYATVEFPTGVPDGLRRVWAATDATIDAPRRLDTDDAASWPAVRGDVVVWKRAMAPASITDWGPLVVGSLAGGPPARLGYPATAGTGANAPSLGDGFVAGDTNEVGVVSVWDLRRGAVVALDRLAMRDPGFVSNVRLAGTLLVWFYTDDVAGGGTREIRWLDLATLGG